MSLIRPPSKIVYNREDGGRDIFVCQEKIGHGGFAVVYRVLHQNTSKVYAMKIISKDGSTSTRGKLFLEKLKNEIQIQKTLDHPNIVRSRLSFSDDINYYIVLEYCPGKSIRDYLRKSVQRRLSEPETRKILNDVIQGLIYLHNHQIIHHDLKLENFLIGSDGRVKIADFGISSILKDDDEKNYSISGTVNYMSPEILQKENKGHSYEVDIWAIGVAAFIMLTGRAPFDGIDREIIYQNIKSADYRFPAAITLSYEAKDFIKSILRVDPRKRPTAINLLTHPFLTKFDKEQVQLYQPPSSVPSNNLNLNLNFNACLTPQSYQPYNGGSLSARSYRDNINSNNNNNSEEPLNTIKNPNFPYASPANFDIKLQRVSSPSRQTNISGSSSARSIRDSIRNYGSQVPDDSLSSIKKLNLNSNLQFSNENSNSNSNSNSRFRRVASPTKTSNNNNVSSYNSNIRKYGDDSYNSIRNLNLDASVPVTNVNIDNRNVSSPIRSSTRNNGSLSAKSSRNYNYQISDDTLTPIKKFNFNSNPPYASPGNLNLISRNISPPIRSTSRHVGSFNERNIGSQVSEDSVNSLKKFNFNNNNNFLSSEPNEMVPLGQNASSSIRSTRNYRSSSARNYVDNIRISSSARLSNDNSNGNSNDINMSSKKYFTLPSHFVAKYCFHKLELGYLLGDGTVGVCFDDKSRIVIDPKESFIQYYRDSNSIAETIILEESVDLVQDDDGENLRDKIRTKILLVQKFAKSLKKSQSLFDYPQQAYDHSFPLRNVKYFLKNDDSILFRLNDKNIQVNFNDHKKLIIFYSSKRICLVRNLKDKCSLIDLKNTANINPNCEELRKYRDAKDLLQSLAQKI